MPNSSRNNQETKTGTILLFENVLVKVGDCPMMDKNAMP